MGVPAENTLVENLLKAVNDAAANARGLFVTLMVLSMYVFVVVAGTDDLALLRNSTVAVPTLSNATLPAKAFFSVLPWVFVFLHLDLVVHFKLLSDKLVRFNEYIDHATDRGEHPGQDSRLRLASFPFATWLAGATQTGPVARLLQGVSVWITVIIIPIGVLLALQLGFLAYQSAAITWTHRVALLVDILTILYFWPLLSRTHGHPSPGSRTFRERLLVVLRRLSTRAFEGRLGFAWASVIVLSAAALAVLPLAVLLGPRSPLIVGMVVAGALILLPGRAVRMLVVLGPCALALFAAFLVFTVPNERADDWGRNLLGRFTRDEFDEQLKEVARRSCATAERLQPTSTTCQALCFVEVGGSAIRVQVPECWSGRGRDANAEETDAMARHREDPWCAMAIALWLPGVPSLSATDQVPGTDPPRRQSSFASFAATANLLPDGMRASCWTTALFHVKGSVLRRTLAVTDRVVASGDVKPEVAAAIRRTARATRDTIERAIEADDADSEAPGTALRRHFAAVDDQYADAVAQLEGLNLTDRSLLWADLSGSSFPGVQLTRAHLDYARMSRSDLREARATETHFDSAYMGQSILHKASMRNASFDKTSLRSAILTMADATGASFRNAFLRHATLGAITANGARFDRADLVAASLRGAHFVRADLTKAKLTGADLRRTVLIGAGLRSADLMAASLEHADLTASDLDQALIEYADLSGARLVGARMEAALVTGVVWPEESKSKRWIVVASGMRSTVDPDRIEFAKLLLAQPSSRIAESAASRLPRTNPPPESPPSLPECIGRRDLCPPASQPNGDFATARASIFMYLACRQPPNVTGEQTSLAYLSRLMGESMCAQDSGVASSEVRDTARIALCSSMCSLTPSVRSVYNGWYMLAATRNGPVSRCVPRREGVASRTVCEP